MEEPSENLTLWQRRVGLFGILLTLTSMYPMISAGRGVDDLIRTLRSPEPILPMTPLIVWISRFLDNYWYLPAIGMIALYWMWMSKSKRRVLWCNAVLAVLIPIVVIVFLNLAFEQQAVISEALRKR